MTTPHQHIIRDQHIQAVSTRLLYAQRMYEYYKQCIYQLPIAVQQYLSEFTAQEMSKVKVFYTKLHQLPKIERNSHIQQLSSMARTLYNLHCLSVHHQQSFVAAQSAPVPLPRRAKADHQKSVAPPASASASADVNTEEAAKILLTLNPPKRQRMIRMRRPVMLKRVMHCKICGKPGRMAATHIECFKHNRIHCDECHS